ncbi:MAG: CvpA family protein [Proteobacteria bacterium]|nr:CvpA family protein [Pseudomonadota bacterium]MBS0462788.1 CvpA family protein [Pseudomonadota bacterium]MBS0463456.1 CvpA family protein [Pseudomonadota bacterium]
MLSSIDWILLVVLALSALFGALRGFVAEVLSMVVWIVAFWLAFTYGADVADGLQSQVHDAAGRLLLAYALVFIVAMLVGSVVSWLISAMVKSLGLGDVNRFLGLCYGLVRGALLGCVLVLVLGWTALPQQPQWRTSPLIPLYQAGAEAMKHWLPEAAAQHISFDSVLAQGKQKVMQTLTGPALPALATQALTAASGVVPPASPAASPTGASDHSSPDAVKSPPRRKPAPKRPRKPVTGHASGESSRR